MSRILQRIPVVGGLAYLERVRRLPSAFTATLSVEPDNQYLPWAIAVLHGTDKVGYVAPEIARRYVAALRERGPERPARCPGRRAGPSDHATSGVELLLDFSALDVAPEA
jgi:hypothetical protein